MRFLRWLTALWQPPPGQLSDETLQAISREARGIRDGCVGDAKIQGDQNFPDDASRHLNE